MATHCRKFMPNIFNKSKCQSCFKAKEQHSAEALENSRVARKVAKCGYLFISPDLDFNNLAHRTKRWQRRFFILYDDGELTYSVDESPQTLPQGEIDMNKCTDVFDAENITTHVLSIAVMLPAKTYYIKGTCKEEINRWHDVLVMYPRSIKTKHRRAPTYHTPQIKDPRTQPLKHSLKENRTPSPEVSPTPSKRHTPSPRHRHKSLPPGCPDNEEEKENSRNFLEVSPRTAAHVELEKTMAEKQELGHGHHERSRTNSDFSISSGTSGSARSTPEPGPLTFRGVRSMKHRVDKKYLDVLRKSRSLQDLYTETNDEDADERMNGLKFRSKSRDDLSSHDDVDGGKPKNLFQSLMHPEPPKDPKDHKDRKTSAYLQMANIPRIRHIDNYVPSDPPRERQRKKSLPSGIVQDKEGRLRFENRPSILELPKSTKQDANQPSTPSSNESRSRQSSISSETERGRRRSIEHIHRNHPRLDLGDKNRRDFSQNRFHRCKSLDRPASRRDSGSSTDSTLSRSRPTSLFNGSADERKNSAPPMKIATLPFRSSGSYGGPNRTEQNLTDETKMAKSSERAWSSSQNAGPKEFGLEQDTSYMKKGWLIKQSPTNKDWFKHWFVLSGHALKFFKDAKAEELNFLMGFIDLSTCHDVIEVNGSPKHYAFKVKTLNGDYMLGAMTPGIRGNWMQAIQKCVDSNGTSPRHTSTSSSSSTDSKTDARARNADAVLNEEGEYLFKRPKMELRNISNPSLSSPEAVTPTPDVAVPKAISMRKDTKIESMYPTGEIEPVVSRRESVSPPRRRTIGSEKERTAIGNVSKQSVSKTRPDADGDSDPDSPVLLRRRSYDDSHDTDSPYQSDREVEDVGRQYLKELQDLEEDIGRLASKTKRDKAVKEKVVKPKTSKLESSPVTAADGDRMSISSEESDAATKPFNFRNSVKDLDEELDRRDGLHGRPKSPVPRPPSIKIKDKSRSKSPGQGHYDGHREDPADEVISPQVAQRVEAERSSRKKEKKVKKSPEKKAKSFPAKPVVKEVAQPQLETQHEPTGEEMLVDLLEAEKVPSKEDITDITHALREVAQNSQAMKDVVSDLSEDIFYPDESVESLKAQLEHTQKELMKTYESNLELKTQIKSSQRDHKDNMDDMENEQNRYIDQIVDMQDEMEHKTDYLHAKLAEQNTKTELTKLQVQTLKAHLDEARDKIDEQDNFIQELEIKLDETHEEFEENKAVFAKHVNISKEERDAVKKMTDDWKKLEKSYEQRFEETSNLLKSKESEQKAVIEQNQRLASDLGEKSQKLVSLEKEIKELRDIEQEWNDKSELLNELESQLRTVQSELEQSRKAPSQPSGVTVEEVKRQFEIEKKALLDKVAETEQRLENMTKQSTMSDSMNSDMMDILKEKDEMITQLEDKLIDGEGKMTDLAKEVNIEMEENSKLEDSLTAKMEELANSKDELSKLQAEVRPLTESMQSEKTENAMYREQLMKVEDVFQMKDRVYGELVEENDNLRDKLDTYKTKLDEQQKQIVELKRASHGGSDLADKYGKAIANLKEVKATLRSLTSKGGKQDGQMLHDLEKKLTATEAALCEGQSSSSPSDLDLDPGCSKEAILSEYATMKRKFERATAELNELNHQLHDHQVDYEDIRNHCDNLQHGKEQQDAKFNNHLGNMASRLQASTKKLAELLNADKGFLQTVPEKEKPKKVRIELGDKASEVETRLLELEENVHGVQALLSIRESSEIQGESTSNQLAIEKQLRETDIALQSSRKTLGDCKIMLQSVKAEVHKNKIESVSKSLEMISQTIDSHKHMDPGFGVYQNKQMRAFAEKLSINAAVMSGVASVVCTSDASSREEYLEKIDVAEDKLKELEALLSKSQADGKTKSGSLTEFAHMLSEKIMVQGELDALISQLASSIQPCHQSPISDAVHDGVYRVALDESLHGDDKAAVHSKFADLAGKSIAHSQATYIVQALQRHRQGRSANGDLSAELSAVLDVCVNCFENRSVVKTEMETTVIRELHKSLSDLRSRYNKGSKENPEKCIVEGLLAYIAGQLQAKTHQRAASDGDQHKVLTRGDSGVGGMNEPLSPLMLTNKQPTLPTVNELVILEAGTQQSVASCLPDVGTFSSIGKGVGERIDNLAAYLSSLDYSLSHLTPSKQAGVVSREAVFQAQMMFMKYRTKLHYDNEIQVLREKLEEIETMAALDNVNSDQLEDIQEDYERRSEKEKVEHSARVKQYENEAARLKGLLEESNSAVVAAVQAAKAHAEREYERKLALKETDFQRRLSETDAPRQADNKTVETLRKEMAELQADLDNIVREKEVLQNDYEDRIIKLEQDLDSAHDDVPKKHQKEMISMKARHNREIETMKMEMKVNLQAQKERENRAENDLLEDVDMLRSMLHEERTQHKLELESLKSGLRNSQIESESHDRELNERIQEMQMKLFRMQDDYKKELIRQKDGYDKEMVRSKHEMAQTVNTAKDDAGLRRKYDRELERLKDVSNKCLALMERSHNAIVREIQNIHKRELRLLRQEKEEELKEETKATQAALDVMRKAHEEDLQKEKQRFKDIVAKMFSRRDIEDMEFEHSQEVVEMRAEIKLLNEQYQLKCQESSSLHERFDVALKSLQDSRRHVQSLLQRNEDMNMRFTNEIDRLKKKINMDVTQFQEGQEVDPEVYELKMAVQLSEVEMQQCREELESLREQLQDAEEDQDETEDKYEHLEEAMREQRSRYEQEIKILKQRLEDTQRPSRVDQPRRVDSPARNGSPSPERMDTGRPGRSKRNARPYDIRRSRSTPGIPVSMIKEISEKHKQQCLDDSPTNTSKAAAHV